MLDNVFLMLAGIYMAFMVYTMSMFPWEVPVSAKVVLLGLMLLVAGIRVLLIGLGNRKVWIGVALCVVYCGVFYVSDNSNFLFLAACTMGFLELDYRKIIRTYLIAVGAALAVVVFAALLGWVENLTFVKNGHMRYSMGTIYPTDFASLVLFLLIYLWVMWKKTPEWTPLALPVISFVIAWKVAYSMTSMICSVLFLGIILYHILDRRVLSRYTRFRTFSDWVMALAVIGFAGMMVFMALTYQGNDGWIQRIDRLTSFRINEARLGLNKYGLHPFGSSFELIGFGESRGKGEWVQGYNFIDCSYLLMLVRYGYLTVTVVTLLWTAGIRSAQKGNDRCLALAMLLIAFHSLSEHHMIEMHYNIALAMPLAAYRVSK